MDVTMNNDDIIKLARQRLSEAVVWDESNRDEAFDDLENLAGRQWDDEMKSAREADSRPCLTINRLPQFARQVTGDIRRMNPATNVIPADSDASKDVADVIEGLVRHIEQRSDGSAVYEQAAESAAQCGMGYWRILAEYEDDLSFNQEIRIKRVHNPFSVYFDPASREPTREDSRYCFITEQMGQDEFEAAYPGKTYVAPDVDGNTDGLEHWHQNGDCVIAEYYWKQPIDAEIGLLPDGRVVESPKAIHNVVKKRKVKAHKVMWAKVTGEEVLEGPQEVPSKHIPVIGVMGEELHLGDEVIRTSVIRSAKDPQRLYNYWRSAQTELVALQPKTPFIGTVKQFQGLEALWGAANDTTDAYLPYNPDEKAPGPPQRSQPPVASQGMMQEVMTAAEDMKATTGIYDASIGNRSNETSGVAIRQRQMESDVSNSIYTDNLAKAISLSGRIIVEMIPRIYDTMRMVRIVGKDEVEEMVQVNAVEVGVDGPVQINPLTVGKYDVRVSVGPNYTTRRQEAAESMMSFVQAFPQSAQVVGDLVAKSMDWPNSDEFVERLKKVLPPQFRDMQDMDPEEQQQAQQQQAQQQQAEQMGRAKAEADITKSMAEAEEARADAEKSKVEAQEAALELALKSGQINEAIAGIVQEQVARALQSVFQPEPSAPQF